MPRISSKHRVTLPVEALQRVGLRPGDQVVIETDGPDRIVITRAPAPMSALGVFDGLYGPDHLDHVRSGERV